MRSMKTTSSTTSCNGRAARHEPPGMSRLQRGDGAAHLVVKQRDGATVLADLYQRPPCRILFPSVEADEFFTAALITTSGGLTGGDRIATNITAGPDCRLTVTTQAAEKIYQAVGVEDVELSVHLTAAAGAVLEWVPQETILFNKAGFLRHLAIDLALDARFLGVETIVFGRQAHGESLTQGRFFDRWRLRRGDKLVWADAQKLDGDLAALLAHPAGFAGARAMCSLVYCAEDAAERLTELRDLLEPGQCRAAVTRLENVLVARFLSNDPQDLRRELSSVYSQFRASTLGLPARLPQLWYT